MVNYLPISKGKSRKTHNIKNKMEKKRKELANQIKIDSDNLTESSKVKASQELDKLIVEYLKQVIMNDE